MSYDQGMDKATADARQFSSQIGGTARAVAAPRDVPSADTLTGQMMHLDEIIKGATEILGRIGKLADTLAPGNIDDGPHPSAGIGKIAPGPESGPLLFRLQNRTGELHNLQSAIHRQLSRIDQVL